MRGLTGTGMQGYHGARKTLGHLEESTWNSREAEASSRTLLESGIGGQPGAPWGKEDYPALWIDHHLLIFYGGGGGGTGLLLFLQYHLS